MKYTTESEWYDLKVTGSELQSRFTLVPHAGSEHGMQEGARKIYVVLRETPDGMAFWYIGEALTSIKKRFQRSFNSYRGYVRHEKARGGYRGYKWIEPAQSAESLKVLVVTFTGGAPCRSFLEAVEGELVFQIRRSTGKWPLYQNEIHFWNALDDPDTVGAIQSAQEIWDDNFSDIPQFNNAGVSH